MFDNLPDWLHFIFGFLGMLTFCFTAAGLLMWITETIRKSMDRASYIHKQNGSLTKIRAGILGYTWLPMSSVPVLFL